MPFSELDEVGPWTRKKLELLNKYLSAYTTILTAQPWCRGVHYIDAFAGASVHVDRETQELLDGSPRIAINAAPPFDRLMFVENDPERVQRLNALKDEHPDRNIEVLAGDCNHVLPHICQQIPGNERAFLLLDPYNLGVRWDTIEAAASAGRHRAIEIMINFSLYDALLNMVRKRPDLIPPHQEARMTLVWGNQGWKKCVFEQRPSLFGDQQEKRDNVARRLSQCFRERLLEAYEHVSGDAIMKNSVGAPIYSLMLASHVGVAKKIMNDIMEYAEQ